MLDASNVKTVSFDCYGTLIDWDGGIGGFLYDLVLQQGDAVHESGRELRLRWESIQFELIQGPYQRYESILAESLRLWCEERGYKWDDTYGQDLARSMRSWQPFHDAKSPLSLARRSGYKLVIISNTDRSIIEHSLRHLEVPFDLVITAEDCGAYKPSMTVFEQALDRIGGPPDEILHIAFGYKYDISPARQIGFKTVWLDRDAAVKDVPFVPDDSWRNLWPLYGLSTKRSLAEEGIEVSPRGKPRTRRA
jgi:2-haloalkanoic acid dehalogenase type II